MTFTPAALKRPTVVHGVGDGRSHWRHLSPLSQPESWNSVAVAIHGHGARTRSSVPHQSLDAFAGDSNSSFTNGAIDEVGEAPQDPVARHLLRLIRTALSAPRQDSHLVIEELALALATRVAHVRGGMYPGAGARSGSLACWQERRAKELLDANLARGISLADLARACKLSTRHFTRAFRTSTGMSPHAWLLHLRIDKAKGLLAKSRCTLADIALDCGFSDQSHFTRTFRRWVGMSPGVWKRLHRD